MTALKLLNFDLHGILAENLIEGETHAPAAAQTRLILPDYGYYFAHSLVVRGVTNGVKTVLTRGVDFRCLGADPDLMSRTCLEVYEGIEIRTQLHDSFEIDYRAVGQHNVANMRQVKTVYDQIQALLPSLEFEDIVGKPREYPASTHTTLTTSLYNLTEVVRSINAIRSAALLGRQASHTELNSLALVKQQQTQTALAELLSQLSSTDLPALLLLISQAQTSLAIAQAKYDQLNNQTQQTLASLQTFDTLEQGTLKNNRTAIVSAMASLLDRQFAFGWALDAGVIEKIPGCVLYINTRLDGAVTQEGQTLIVKDYSPQGHVFQAPVAQAPAFVDSQRGLEGKVLSFTSAKYLTKSAGPALALRPGMTLFCVYSTKGSAGTGLQILGRINAPTMQVRMNTRSTKAVNVLTAGNVIYGGAVNQWTPQRPTLMQAELGYSQASPGKACSNNMINARAQAAVATSGLSALNHPIEQIGFSVASSDEGELQALVLFDRILESSTAEGVRAVLRRMFGFDVCVVSNPHFDYGKVGYTSGYPMGVVGYPSCDLTSLSYAQTFADNAAEGDDGSYGAELSNKLAVRGGHESLPFYQTPLATEIGCTYRLTLSLYIGQIEEPDLHWDVDGTQHAISLVTGQGKQSVSFIFRASANNQTLKLFNLNTAISGNTFMVDDVIMARDIFWTDL